MIVKDITRKNMKNKIYEMTIDDYLAIIDLAKAHGKNQGDSMQQELEEIMEKKQGKIKLIGETNKDSDVLTGDLREEGIKVLNLNEEIRKAKLDENR